MADLRKVFVWVPGDKKTEAEVITISRQSENSEKIYFMQGSGAIIVNGIVFGGGNTVTADLTEIKSILAGFGTEVADPNKTVAAAIAKLKSDILGAYGTSETAETIKGLDTRVKTIEDLVKADENNVVDKLEEIITWFNDLPENSQLATELVADVAANKEAIGEKGTAAVGTEGEEDYKPATPTTGLYKEIADVEAKVDAIVGELPEGKTIAEVIEAIEDEIGTVPEKSTVMDEVAKAKTTVTKAENSFVTVTPATDETDGHTEYTVGLTTSTLNGVLGGIDKNEAGQYVFTAADDVVDGLATAADVAAVIVSNEEVIAAAFNDHESRVVALENHSLWDTETYK